MSEQSPWGTPPPTAGPYGAPAQPYTAGGYAGGPPSYGVPLHGPGGPQGPRKRTGLIVAIATAVVVVIAAFVVTFVVTSGDDDGDTQESDQSPASSDTSSDSPSASDSASDSPSDSPSESASGPSETPSDTASPSTTAAPTGETVTGNGYSFELPGVGWTDVTDEAKSSVDNAPSIDTVIVLGSSIPLSQSNVIIEASGDGGASSLEDLEGLWKRNLIATDGATTTDIDDITIAGERAIGVEISGRSNAAGEPIRQIVYLVQHDGRQYSLGLSYATSGDEVSRGDFEKLIASWTWDS